MDILTKTGALRARTEGWSYSGTFMGERSLTCEVSSPVPVDFRTGDYTLLAVRDGVPERFELEGLPPSRKRPPQGATATPTTTRCAWPRCNTSSSAA